MIIKILNKFAYVFFLVILFFPLVICETAPSSPIKNISTKTVSMPSQPDVTTVTKTAIATPGFPPLPVKKKDPVLDSFNQILSQATKLIKELFALVNKTPTFIRSFAYSTTTVLEFLGNDSAQPTKKIGFVLYLGTPGDGGSLGGFEGFIIDVRLDSLPGVFGAAFTNLSKELLKNILMGTTSRDARSGLVTLKSNPLFEFFLRLCLLVKDRQTMSAADFSANLFKLMIRFVSTPGLKNPEKALDKLPPFLAPILNGIKFGKKTAYDYLSAFLKDISYVFNYDFSQEKNDALDVKDTPEVIKIALAIVARAMIEYSEAYQKFAKTPEGTAAIKMAKATNKEKVFYNQIPELTFIKSNMVERAAGLVQRFTLFRLVRKKILDAVAPSLNPVLKSAFDITLDDLFPDPGIKKKEQISAQDQAVLDQVNDLLGNDVLLSPSESTVEQTVPKQKKIKAPSNIEEHVRATLVKEELVPLPEAEKTQIQEKVVKKTVKKVKKGLQPKIQQKIIKTEAVKA